MTESGASAEAIRHHYDVGTDFFKLWLDAEMVYSAARWQAPFGGKVETSLEAAQIAKLDYHLNAIRANECGTVLDIGCGWGALLRRAIIAHGVQHAIGLSLSPDQCCSILKRGWGGVGVIQGSYEDAYIAPGTIDGIVSVGAFEHFAKPSLSPARKLNIYTQFFGRCHQWLQRHGSLSLQTICWGGNVPLDRTTALLPLDIFPESDLPYVHEVVQASEKLFALRYAEEGRMDYIRTLEAWSERLSAKRREIEAMGIDFAYYDNYMRRSLAGFRRRRMTLMRFVFERIH